MKKVSSIELMIMGTLLIPLALLSDNVYAKIVAATASIILNIVAVVKSFKEKNESES